MKNRSLVLTFLLAAEIIFLTAASPQELKDSPPGLDIVQNSAKPGEVFEGVVYRESGKELYLDRTPCAPPNEKKLKPFVQPYVKTKTDNKVRCGKETFQLVRVEKK
jgi:hypothetical protein